MKQKLILSVFLTSAVTLSALSYSMSSNIDKESIYLMSNAQLNKFISTNIKLNTQDITIYDAPSDLKSELPLKIVNSTYFKNFDILLSLSNASINWENDSILIELSYRLAKQKESYSLTISKSFNQFKFIDVTDWSRIFSNVAKISKIKWYGKNDSHKHIFKISNKYATVSDVVYSPFEGEWPQVEKIFYNLKLDNSKKVIKQEQDKASSSLLSGGNIIYKGKSIITFKYPNNKGISIESYVDSITPPDEIPQIDKGIFIRWSTHQDAKLPNVFINNEENKFEQDTILYPVYKYKPKLTLKIASLNEKEDKTVSYYIKDKLTRENLVNFIDQNRPWPLDKWSYSTNDLKFSDSENNIHSFSFDEDGNSTDKWELEKEYQIILDYKHKPVFIYNDQENDEFITYQWMIKDEEKNQYFTPDANIDFSAFETEGRYPKTLVNRNFESIFTPNKLIENYEEKDNDKFYIDVYFQKTKKVEIATDIIKKENLTKNSFYLTPDNKLKEKYLPKNIDYSWYIGQDLRLFKDKPNNEFLDQRTKQEKEKGVVFEGWYSDAKFKNKIEFENGVSKQVINSKKIYPRFTPAKWDKIRDAREILDPILKGVETTLSSAGAFVNNYAEYTQIAALITGLIKQVLYLGLGGKLKEKEFWDSSDYISQLLSKGTSSAFNKDSGKPQTYFDILEKLGINRKKDGNTLKSIFGSNHEFINGIFWFLKNMIQNIWGAYEKYGNNPANSSFILDSDIKKWKPDNILNFNYKDIDMRVRLLKFIILNHIFPVDGHAEYTNNTWQIKNGIYLSVDKKFSWIIQENLDYTNTNNYNKCSSCCKDSSNSCSTSCSSSCASCSSCSNSNNQNSRYQFDITTILDINFKNLSKSYLKSDGLYRVHVVADALVGKNSIFNSLLNLINTVVDLATKKEVHIATITSILLNTAASIAKNISTIFKHKFWDFSDQKKQQQSSSSSSGTTTQK